MVWNELKKLITIKPVWVVFIVFLTSIIIAILVPAEKDDHTTFAENFIKINDHAPYDYDLIKQYKELNTELVNCQNEGVENKACYDGLSVSSKQLYDQYSDFPFTELLYATIKFRDLDREINHILNKTESTEPSNDERTVIETYFNRIVENKMKNNLVLNGIKKGEIFYIPESLFSTTSLSLNIFFVSVLSFIVLVLSIGLSYSNDDQLNTNYLILTSKIGRRIIKKRILASSIFSIIVTILLFVPLFVVQIIKGNGMLLLNAKVNTVYNMNYWYDFTLVQMLLSTLLLLLISNITIAIITSFISIYSKKYINIIVYSFLTMSVIVMIIKILDLIGAKSVLTQSLKILALHTPYAFFYKNLNLFKYSTDYLNSFDSYPLYPFIFGIVNLLMIILLTYKSDKFYYKMNF